ncbi:aldose 1-epimerase family protein [Desulfosporosinus sp. BICA1-9]|uniref:aldose 1-epimerase family protein n=1 Tax=Desulfosporosinus sp. BICA1-9 TaxID=1531958 RepID=UPI0005F1B25E|nr:aldose 1-epimerase family protein [Desulfosporosinus sp. BICA1-9]KJS50575.1 MAG: hypothetical protein VR66_02160 [Peptococcaceae bacterium BRH_c23]KJS82842.1 MAG: hypothetical protein JL57_23805 [Desulfosporosinus sp. BICA1-9]
MVKLFGKEFEMDELRQYVGSMNQLAGARVFEYKNGRADGIKGIDVKTGSGFRFTVLPDRGMDIADAEYCGKSLAWMCKNNLAAPQYFENGGLGFLRSFNGGLITTCGLTQAGDPGVEGDEVLGIHGRISHLPAEIINVEENWCGDDYVIKLSGKIRESRLYAENLVLKREIICKMGESKVLINDLIENEGYNESPFMILYHINFGFPIVSKETRLYSSAIKVEPFNRDAREGDGEYSLFDRPTKGYQWQGFMHIMPQDREKVYAGLVNESIDFGGYVAYSPEQMPCFNEWKMMGQQDYVVGLEPGINIPEGRIEARRNGRLTTLKPGERYEINFEIGVLEDRNAIERFKAMI